MDALQPPFEGSPRTNSSQDSLSVQQQNKTFFSCLDLLDEILDLREELERFLREGYFELALEQRRGFQRALQLSVLSAAVETSVESTTIRGYPTRPTVHKGSCPSKSQHPSPFFQSRHIQRAASLFTEALRVSWEIEGTLQKALVEATNFSELSSACNQYKN